MLQKAYAEGMRALVLYTACVQDRVAWPTPAATARRRPRRAAQRPAAPAGQGLRLGEVVRAARPQSLQTFGGSGYLQDYPIEQYIRDAKIDTLYEGTTAIQGQDLFFRKIVRDQGKALTQVAAEIRSSRRARTGRRLGPRARAARRPRSRTSRASSGARRLRDERASRTPPSCTRWGRTPPACCSRSATLVVGWLLLRQAEVALDALQGRASERDRDFYRGKVATAQFFARQRLPAADRRARHRRGDRQRADGPARVRLLTAPTAFGDPVAGHCSLPGGAEGEIVS